MINLIKKNTFYPMIFLILIIDILSLIGHSYNLVNIVIFLILVCLFTIISLKDLYFGFIALLTELTIGSFGYLFSLNIFGFNLSIRMAFFVIFFILWAYKYLRYKKILQRCSECPITKWVIIFFIFLIFGILNGVYNGNSYNLIFSDVNGYFYLILICTLPATILKRKNLQLLYNSILAGITYFSLKTLLLFYFFSHGFKTLNKYLYLWIRDSRIGEITLVSKDFSFQRIFLQSQIYEVFGIVIVLFVIYAIIKKGNIKRNQLFTSLGLFILFLTTIIISFSRSFWVGLLFFGIIFIIYIFYELFSKKISIKNFTIYITYIISSFVLSLVLLLSIIYFPIPTPGAFDISLIANRATSISGESAVSSRWNLLPKLTEKIKESILLGSGFGTTVTYNSNDPRIKNESNPTGKYTTSTFEWGFLDLITEIGILGALVYLIFYFKLFHKVFDIYLKLKSDTRYVFIGLTLSLLTLFIINFFTPYLNHPLGVGFLLFAYILYIHQIKINNVAN